MAIGSASRCRAPQYGYNACVCRMCCPRGGKGKGEVKRKTNRAVRRSERAEVAEACD